MSAISYKILYKVGFTPWEGSAEQARTREQISEGLEGHGC